MNAGEQNHEWVPQASGTRAVMNKVMLALIPGTAMYAVLVSPGVILNVLFAVICALLIEALCVRLQNRNGIGAISDGSIALAAWLLALSVPPLIPFWQLGIGVLCMVFLGKQVYGGIGQNPFNPAMVGYCVLMVSFPQSMTFWPDASAMQSLSLLTHMDLKSALMLNAEIFGEHVVSEHSLSELSIDGQWDGVTQATVLETTRLARLQSVSLPAIEYLNRLLASGWLWVNLAFLLGGLWLLWQRVISWHIPLSVLLSFLAISLLFTNSPAVLHYSLFAGALIFGAFFIATDPVTCASSPAGRLVFGCGVGCLTFVIREYGGYPDGFAFAILLMNICVPLIDYCVMQWQNRL